MARTITRTSRSGRAASRGVRAASRTALKPAAAAAEPKPDGASSRRGRRSDFDRAIGAKVRKRRSELGMTPDELAKAVGVSFHQVQRYERGDNRLGGSRLDAVAKALQVPVSYFFGPAGERTGPARESLLDTPGAVALLKAYAAIEDEHQRRVLINLMRAVAGEEPLQEGGEGR